QEAMPSAALSGAGDLAALPEQIKSFRADEAASAQVFRRAIRKLSRNTNLLEGGLNPLVQPPVAVDCLELIPGIRRRENHTVSPVGVVRHQAAAGGAAHQRAQRGHTLHLGKFLKVTKARGQFAPAIKTQHWFAALGSGLQ